MCNKKLTDIFNRFQEIFRKILETFQLIFVKLALGWWEC